MILPRVLVIDDQYARDRSERRLFLKRSRMRELDAQAADPDAGAIAAAVFCSGQRIIGGKLVNDFSVVADAIVREPKDAWALALLDMRFDSGVLDDTGEPRGSPGDETFGETLRRTLSQRFPELPIVILTERRHADLTEHNVAYLSKREISEEAVAARLLEYGRLTASQMRGLLGLGAEATAQAQATLDAFRQAWSSARTGQPVLILGETGTGKEVLARYIHKHSGRSKFVDINVSAIPPDLFESEMFGAKKGAFSGMSSDIDGYLQNADKGTLFLDEIADLSPQHQPKFLRAIETGQASRLGEPKEKYDFDVRFISATLHDFADRVENDLFRKDLYYRLAARTIVIPPLRDRREDIAALAAFFLGAAVAARSKSGITIAPEALRRLEEHDYPGNVRELRDIMTGIAAVVSSDQVILVRDVEGAFNRIPGAIRAGGGYPRAGQRSTRPSVEVLPNLEGSQRRLSRQELTGALTEITGTYGRLSGELIEQALEFTRHLGKGRGRQLGDLNPTAAMKLLLARPDLTTAQAADEIKRLGAIAGEPTAGSLFAQALEWARSLRRATAKERAEGKSGTS